MYVPRLACVGACTGADPLSELFYLGVDVISLSE